MIDLCYSNRTEPLLDALAENVTATQATLYDPVNLLVPNAFVADYVAQGLARRRGIAAHVKTRFLRAFLRDVAEASAPDLRIVDRDVLEGELLALFHDDDRLARAGAGAGARLPGTRRRRSHGAGSAARAAGGAAGRAVRRVRVLAARHAGGVAARAASSSGWNEPLQRWQRALWLALFGPRRADCPARDSATLPEFFARTPPADAARARPRARVRHLVRRAPLSIDLRVAGARDAAVRLHAEPVPRAVGGPAAACAARRPGGARSSRQLALALGDDDGRRRRRPPPTRIRCSRCGDGRAATASGSTTTCPTATSASASRIRRPAWRRRRCSPRCSARCWTARRAAASRRRTTTAWRCSRAPDPRRELETVAAEIWSLVRRDPTLRFDDFAVVVPPASAETYLPLAREVFTSASELPHTVLDLPSPAEGHVLEAVELLLALPLGAAGPARSAAARDAPDGGAPLSRRRPAAVPRAVRGAGHRARRRRRRRSATAMPTRIGSAGTRGCGGSRWARSCRARAAASERPFAFGGGAVLPAELPAGAEPAARALGIIARELIDFARTAARDDRADRRVHGAAAADAGGDDPRRRRRRAGGAARLLRGAGADRGDGAARSRGRLRRSPPSWCARGWAPRAAAGARADGVTVATLRAAARADRSGSVFVVGLDERVFPSAQGFGALDLRGARRRSRATSRRASRTNTCSSRRCCRRASGCDLSYVGRDAVTGERKDPSSTLLALRDVLASEPRRRRAARARSRARARRWRGTRTTPCAR